MVSLGTMIRKISGLADTVDLTDWENRFIKHVEEVTKDGLVTSMLSEAQINKIEALHDKHFA